MSHDKQRGTHDLLLSYLTPTASQSAIPAEELLTTFDSLCQTNNIDEFGILYVDQDQDQDKDQDKDKDIPKKIQQCAKDAFSIPEPGKLGIAAWSLRALFAASKQRFDQHRLKRSNSVDHNDNDNGVIMDDGVIMNTTRPLLLLHPYSYTAWNARKSCLVSLSTEQTTQQYKYKLFKQELQFVDLVFTTHPKIGEAWEHRSWCVKQIFQQCHTTRSILDTQQQQQQLPSPALTLLLKHEIDICELVAERYPKNYYAWSHRQRVVEMSPPDIVVADLTRTGTWCHTHPSDHSAFHHRQSLWCLVLFALRSKTVGLGRKKLRKRWPAWVQSAVEKYDTHHGLLYESGQFLTLKPQEVFDPHYDIQLRSSISLQAGNVEYNTRYNQDAVDLRTEERLLLVELEWLQSLTTMHPTLSTTWSHRQWIMQIFYVIRPDKFVQRMEQEMQWIEQLSLRITPTTTTSTTSTSTTSTTTTIIKQQARRYLEWVRRNVAPFDDKEEQRLHDSVKRWNLVVSYIGRPFAGFQRQSNAVEKTCPSVQGVLEEVIRDVLWTMWNNHSKYEPENQSSTKSSSSSSSMTVFPGWLMVNGDRTDRGCNALHHDIDIVLCKMNDRSALHVWQKVTALTLCNAINERLQQVGLEMVLPSSSPLVNKEGKSTQTQQPKQIRAMKRAARRDAENAKMCARYKVLPLRAHCCPQKLDTTNIANLKQRCKRYTYYVTEGTVNVEWMEKTWYIGRNNKSTGPRRFDLGKIRAALSMLCGWHDFSSFGGKCDRGKGWRYVFEATVDEVTHCLTPSSFLDMASTGVMVNTFPAVENTAASEDKAAEDNTTVVYAITVVASGFLNHMMRRIVGTVRAIGEDRRNVTDVSRMLLGEMDSGPAAPARGLWRMGVEWRTLPEHTLDSSDHHNINMEQTQQLEETPAVRKETEVAGKAVNAVAAGVAAAGVVTAPQAEATSDHQSGGSMSLVDRSRASGGHVVGNFPKYYKFNPIEERLHLFRSVAHERWTSCGSTDGDADGGDADGGAVVTSTPSTVVLLDIGCNSGDLSLGMLHMLRDSWQTTTCSTNQKNGGLDVRLLGIDVDAALIRRARVAADTTAASTTATAQFHTYDVCDAKDVLHIQAALNELRGSNINSNETIDSGGRHHTPSSSDITFVFGITMWIHLHHGDLGLQKVLTALASMTSTTMVVEIHPWKNYKSAIKRIKKQSLPIPCCWNTIQHRGPNGPEHFIQQIMLQNGWTLKYDFGKTGWKREIHSYERINRVN